MMRRHVERVKRHMFRKVESSTKDRLVTMCRETKSELGKKMTDVVDKIGNDYRCVLIGVDGEEEEQLRTLIDEFLRDADTIFAEVFRVRGNGRPKKRNDESETAVLPAG